MLIDQCTIYVRSGKGGNGCVSFRREKYVPKGGPDGGDGGRGGDVVLVTDPSLTTLLPLTPRPHKRATNGQPGKGKSMHGADGEDCIVRLPPGTIVVDAESDAVVIDLDRDDERYVIAEGGEGGLGNEHFKSATNQAPREATPGGEWVERTLRLELKLVADLGLIGLPNAGKSTLLRAVSRATPKVADYPFTTLQPHLGIAALTGERRMIVADIPGLIEGAADGAGLGHDFLRHIERTSVLVHLLDAMPVDGGDPIENYRVIRKELGGYSPALAAKPEVVALNKIDLVPEGERDELAAKVRQALGLESLTLMSGATGEGTRDLMEAAWTALGAKADEPGWQS
jgi:GTP-binding protein